MHVGDDATHPIMGALYHPPGGIIRHDAVVWGFARGADAGGAEIHPYTEVTGLERANGRITRVQHEPRRASRPARSSTRTAGWSTLIYDMAGVPLPITTHILQACVTEPVKPLLDVVIVSSQMHVYISQTDRGEFVMGSEIEPWTTYRMNGTLNFLQDLTRHTLELFPQLEHARILRAWAGLCDLSPDYSPILGQTEVENFHVSAGWGTYGFKAAPIVGQTLAELVDTGPPARPDRAVQARALLRGRARLRARRRRRQPLSPAETGPTPEDEEQPGDRAGSRAHPDRADRGGVRPGARRDRAVRPLQGARSASSVLDRLADRPDGKLDLRHRHDADEGGRGQDDDARRPHPGPRRTSASGRSRACASRRSAPCSASRAAPPAAA